MEEIVRQITSVLTGMWKFRWPGLIVAWVVSIVGVIVVFKIPDQYEASARIYVDTQSILKPLMAGLTVQPNVEQQVGMLSRTLISRPNVEKLIRMADLDLKSDSKIEQEALVDRLTKEIQIRNTGRDNLYSLAFRDSDQEKSKRVIQSLVSIFVESSLGASRKDTDSAKTFLNEQIKQLRDQAGGGREARLKEFRLRNLDLQAAPMARTRPRAVARWPSSWSRPSSNCARPRTRAMPPSSSWQPKRRQGRSLLPLPACCRSPRSRWRRPRSMGASTAQKRNLDSSAAALHRSAPGCRQAPAA